MLFTDRSLWTMVHGIVFGGAAIVALSAALAAIYLLRSSAIADSSPNHARTVGLLSAAVAASLWLTSLVGMLVVFPPYRATPPEGTENLSAYPRSLVLSNPETAWLHAYAMETKEHLPWIAVMVATVIGFIALRSGASALRDPALRKMSLTLLAICFVIVGYVSLLGVFVNKVAPLY